MMKIQPAVKKETLHIAFGTAVGVAVMLAVFAAIGMFRVGVLVSGLIGGALAVFNFFLLGVTVQKITAQDDDGRGRKMMQFSYNMRMLLMVVWLIVAMAAPFFNWVAGMIPLLLPRLTIAVMQLTGRYKKDESEKAEQLEQNSEEGE